MCPPEPTTACIAPALQCGCQPAPAQSNVAPKLYAASAWLLPTWHECCTSPYHMRGMAHYISLLFLCAWQASKVMNCLVKVASGGGGGDANLMTVWELLEHLNPQQLRALSSSPRFCDLLHTDAPAGGLSKEAVEAMLEVGWWVLTPPLPLLPPLLLVLLVLVWTVVPLALLPEPPAALFLCALWLPSVRRRPQDSLT